MRTLPRISLSVHGLAELTLGIALTVAGLVLGLGLGAAGTPLGDTGTLLTLLAGFTLIGFGVGAVQDLPLAAHRSLDHLLVVALAGLAVACAVAGNAVAAVVLLASAALVLALEAGTRWTRPI